MQEKVASQRWEHDKLFSPPQAKKQTIEYKQTMRAC